MCAWGIEHLTIMYLVFQVGYGKTAITLGLIDSAQSINGPPPLPPQDFRTGFVFTKATLVVVPGHLMGQWPDEIEKFLGKGRKKVVIIKDLSSLNSLLVSDVTSADIVVVNFTVLSNEKYYTRLARLSGVDPGGFASGRQGGRHFDAVYKQCLICLPRRVEQIVSGDGEAYSAIEADARAHKNVVNHILSLDNKKAAYKNGDSSLSKHATASLQFKVDEKDRDPWGLSTQVVKKDYSKMKCSPLEMFFWNRIVIDE